MSDFLPSRESMLVQWATDFVANVVAIGATNIGLVAAQQTALQASVTAFVSAYGVANDPATRTRPTIELKRTKKAQMIALVRQLAGIIQKHPGTTDAQRAQLGLTVPQAVRPATTPGTPTDFKVMLNGDGSLQLKWKCANGGLGGTMYQVYRRIGAAGEFVYLGGSGGRRFIDDTVPAGTVSVTYQIQGVRPTAVGEWAQFLVNFAKTGGGLTVTEQATTKLAA